MKCLALPWMQVRRGGVGAVGHDSIADVGCFRLLWKRCLGDEIRWSRILGRLFYSALILRIGEWIWMRVNERG